MKYLLYAGALAALVAGHAQAAEPTIDSACIRAAAAIAVSPNVVAYVVQSFPDLTPPRVKIRYKLAQQDQTNGTVLTCKFQRTKPPFGLTELCVASGCVSADVSTPTGRALYEEVSTLLKREGL